MDLNDDLDAQASAAMSILMTHAGNIQALASLWYDPHQNEDESWWVCLVSLADGSLHTHYSGNTPQAVVEEAIEDSAAWPVCKRSFWEINCCMVDCLETDDHDIQVKGFVVKRQPFSVRIEEMQIRHMYASTYQN